MEQFDAIEIRKRILDELKRRGITPTSQALSSIIESFKRTPEEIVGDSDSLLLGLLFSGSYTIDVLEDSGVDPVRLRRLASQSVQTHSAYEGIEDAMYAFFDIDVVASDYMLKNVQNAEGILETSDILKAAITVDYDYKNEVKFPLEQRKDNIPKSILLKDLEKVVCRLLHYTAIGLNRDNYREMLSKRRHGLYPSEIKKIRKSLREEGAPNNDIEFCIRAFNEWLRNRRILTDPPEECLRATFILKEDFSTTFSFGSKLFADSGGNIKTVEAELEMARKFSPERDLPFLSLISNQGRIMVSQYTYRNKFMVDTNSPIGNPIRPVSIQAICPSFLINTTTLSKFEALLNSENLNELKIQHFLSLHPELLEVLGYKTARPHLCLKDDDGKSLIPDFVLELPGNLGFDILDLKMPNIRLTVRNPYLRASHELIKAMAQLRKYEKFFETSGNRKAFHKKYGLNAFKPQLIIVIGRSSEFHSIEERFEIEKQINMIRLVTYDDILAYGKSRALYIPKNGYLY